MRWLLIALVAVVLPYSWLWASVEPPRPLPAAAATKVDFQKHIKPLLEKNCLSCHTQGKHRGGLSLESRADLLEGGESGAVVRVGDSASSLLIHLVAGHEPERIMPAKGDRLTADEIGLLRAWIDQGMLWPSDLTFGFPRMPIQLNVKPLPSGNAKHPIDRWLDVYCQQRQLPSPDVVSDALFARRVYLDLIGLLPEPERLHQFILDSAADKREKLIDELLLRKEEYADHWMTFWNDHLRNAYRGTGFIDGGRKTITTWLHRSLLENKPYDRMVRELIFPTPESEGFIKGFVWRGVVNASQSTPIQAAQNVAQVFLGTNLKCASCHDSFVNHWRLKDAYALANVFSDKPLEIHRCDKPTGKTAQLGFIYPELGDIDAKSTQRERQRQLADLITKKENGRLARTIINRLWAQLLGRGLVANVDDMDQPAWSPELLDWLARDFIEHGYDLKHALRVICTSKAYQWPIVRTAENPQSRDDQYRFQGPVARRMTAEQFLDALATLTSVWPQRPAIFLPDSGTLLFDSPVMRNGSLPIDVDIRGFEVLRLLVHDGGNGKHFDWANWGEPRLAGPQGTFKLTELEWVYATTGHGQVMRNRNVNGDPLRIGDTLIEWGWGTHAPSEMVFRLPSGYTRFRATIGPDDDAVQKKTAVSVKFQVYGGTERSLRVRAVRLNDDDLSKAMGRPSREQVVTRRESLATLIQALEMTNGRILDQQLQQGAAQLVERYKGDGEAIVQHLFVYGLGRKPTDIEMTLARQLISSPAQAQGVADFLWAMLMLPEFQFID